MQLKTKMMGAALSLSMLPLAAGAGEVAPCPEDQQPGSAQYQQYQQPDYSQYQQYPQAPAIQVGEPSPYGRGWEHGRFRRNGRYEMRAVQQWVEGRYQQVWVAEQCSMRERQHGWVRTTGMICVPAHYDQQWQPGHYEQVQQWVWVPVGGRSHGRFQAGISF
ncbi:MAG TPA: hypothetical protein VND93_14155 [Myxococcales bacterium]|jgi:hypothetical protein|nr:hypothetical protein [Myxococcales bacterium]